MSNVYDFQAPIRDEEPPPCEHRRYVKVCADCGHPAPAEFDALGYGEWEEVW